MNINVQGLTLFNRIGASKSTLDRLDRQEKRDNKIAFIEKEKLLTHYKRIDLKV